MKRVSWPAFAAAMACAAPAAAADPPAPTPAEASPADAKAEARAHFEKARALAGSGVWPAALAEFLASRRLYATWGNTLGAASSLQKLERFDEALDLFEILLKDFADALSSDVRAAAQREVVGLRGLVGTIEVEGAEIGAAIAVDGRARGDYPTVGTLRVAAGSHLVRVYKEGFEPFETGVDVAGRALVRVPVRLRALAASGRLRVAEQGGAALEVIIDGDRVGKTPWEGLLAVGEHVVVLRGEGDMGTQPVSVPVRRGETAPLTLAAEELAAPVRVEPVPVNAGVAVDSVVVGRGIWEGRLRAGRHKIEVAAAGFVTDAREVTLERGKRAVVTVALSRDSSSPFWREPPRPSHGVLEVSVAAAVVPSFGGDLAGGCAGACSAPPGAGFLGVLRGGWELGSGFGFGLSAGFLTARQTASGRAAQLAPVGLKKVDTGTVDDTIALRYGGLAGAWAGFSFGSRFPVHLRLGAGALLASVTDTRTGAFKSQIDQQRFNVGPISDGGFVPFVYAAPEVRVGLRLGKHVELSLGVEALVLVAPSPTAWNAKREINAGSDGIGTFPADRLIGRGIFVVSPGVGARYDF
jgi:hypothetical protein